MLSITCKAAIKAVIYLGSTYESGNKSSIKEIADFIGENEHTVGKILQTLVRADVIMSIKGPGGGFYITAQQQQTKVIDIIMAIDGNKFFHECGLGLNKCSEKKPCPIHKEYGPIREAFKKLCTTKKIKDLYKNVNSGITHLV